MHSLTHTFMPGVRKPEFPKWGRLVKGEAIWAKWPKTALKLQTQNVWVKTVGGISQFVHNGCRIDYMNLTVYVTILII